MDFQPGPLVLKSINLHFPGGMCFFLEGGGGGQGREWIMFNPKNMTTHNLKHSLHFKLTFKDCSGLICPALFSLHISSVHNSFLKLMGIWHVAGVHVS